MFNEMTKRYDPFITQHFPDAHLWDEKIPHLYEASVFSFLGKTHFREAGEELLARVEKKPEEVFLNLWVSELHPQEKYTLVDQIKKISYAHFSDWLQTNSISSNMRKAVWDRTRLYYAFTCSRDPQLLSMGIDWEKMMLAHNDVEDYKPYDVMLRGLRNSFLEEYILDTYTKRTQN